jgi:hypothetical protein
MTPRDNSRICSVHTNTGTKGRRRPAVEHSSWIPAVSRSARLATRTPKLERSGASMAGRPARMCVSTVLSVLYSTTVKVGGTRYGFEHKAPCSHTVSFRVEDRVFTLPRVRVPKNA